MSTALLCLPFAGAGASFFQPWRAEAGDELVVVPLQLPGRERRIDDEPYTDVFAAVEGLLAELPAEHDEVALFGHSLGAVLAYELAHRLVARGTVVRRLFASGSPEPGSPRRQRATGLPDDEFLRRVAEFAGYRHDALADEEMRELILPTLRADVEMHENYRPHADEALPVPITALRGRDDELVTADEVAGWVKVAGRDFEYAELPGGHMHLVDSRTELLGLIRGSLGCG
ncbi:thioesterase II family protein [Amycolatopsis sp. FDAARGOS 1241]|uniref:thioesterase II family protein n=1 Tax=Amycolatopsis sp. FDAARGOS 1241 TaxID=2778070 RepID=UPI001952232D|nr:alpha/beta fold hydrolase [Amycolatopsis sp. FDAARGOS 1241]QRP47067.1 thioesterase [Amycolatopsis sp. FDAARGOS 1241]